MLLERFLVAPRAGAWIETLESRMYYKPKKSLPVRERGLKHQKLQKGETEPLSLPVRERGLKLSAQPSSRACPWVAPRAGAWIET